MSGPLPERTIMTLLNIGVAALVADLGTAAPGDTVLDDILSNLADAERAKARDYFADHVPTIIQGYPRKNVVFPLVALVLQSDTEANRYLGLGERDTDMMGVKDGVAYDAWTQGQFGIYVYAEHPDLCAWYYRIMRRVLQVGFLYLIHNNLDNPSITGAELAPDPRYTPENLFVRRLVLTVEYEEEWNGQDALWIAINGGAEDFIIDPNAVDVRHVDSHDPLDGGPPGGIVPISVDLD